MAYLIGSADTTRFSSTYAINSGASGTGLHLVGNPTDTAAVATGTARNLSIYVSSWGAQTNIKCCLYDESNAGALLETVVFTSADGTGLLSKPLAGTSTITIGNNYRLGIYTEDADDITMFSDTGGLTLRKFSTSGSYTTPADPSNQSGGFDSFNEFYFAVDDVTAGPSITQSDTTPEDGVQQTVTCTGMTGPITAATLGGYDILSLLNGTDPASPITYTLDISSLAEGTNASLPRLGVSLDLVFTTATDGAVTQSGIVIQPKTGWALVELEDIINKDANGLIATIEADTGLTVTNADALYYETANNASITVNGVYTSDLTTAGQLTKIILQDGGTSPATSYSDGFYPYGEAGGSGSKVVQSINISSIKIGL